MKLAVTAVFLLVPFAIAQQNTPEPAAATPAQATPAQAAPAEQTRSFTVSTGTRVPLVLINSISTKSAQEGDQIYLETAFPVVVEQKIVIPPGSYVKGTVTQVKRPGRVKGRGEVYLRFDTLTLPNGITRDFRGRVGAVDGSGAETLDKREGKIQGDTSKGGDAGTIATTGASGAGIGAIAGSAGGRSGLGTGIGAAAGATAGLITVLLTRGPEVQLFRGTELDMVLDRPLTFSEDELRFEGPMYRSSVRGDSVRERSNGRGTLDRIPTPFPRVW